ncbi:copper amine oxidase N-terminal domain-containing protein [[Clostridium] colinum]|uniref:copper amine oxidase N-terminal domain-containing protein n=1 Tax=[Clostridium] colinum TaxID=36835 RepID=UPI0020258F3F|nr:copper amine oxidase N-terminal domain-containing protein [[Clostridium] colinum]
MVNKLKKSFTLLTLVFIMLMPSVSAFGAEPVYVKLNGAPIVYEDAQPQIMNQRAMVPFRKTAETLGAVVEWNKQTETATLRKGDRVVVHTMRSSVITVNGKASTFDTPSAVVQNRTMMPVRMLSEALGNSVTWDNSTRTVNIIADQPTVINVVPDKTTVNSGEKINIAITTNSTTDKIKIVDVNENDSIISEANTYSSNPDGTRLFSVPWTPNVAKSTFKTLKVVPGNLTTYNQDSTSYKVCAISVNADVKPKVTSFKSDKKDVGRGDKIKLTIEANANTDRIKIGTEKNNKLLEITNYKLGEGNNSNIRVFETEMKMEDRGDIELRAYPGNISNGYESSYETLKISVGGSGSTTSTEKLKIKDTYILNDGIYVDETIKVIVKTSTDIDRVEILNENDKIVDETRFTSVKNNSEYIWLMDIPVKSSGRNRFYVVAYNTNKDKVKESISFSASTYSSSDLEIINIEQRDIGAVSGDTVKFRIRTTNQADSIKVFDGSSEVAKVTDYNNNGSIREWEVKVKITSSNKDSLKVVAYDKNQKQTSTKLNVYLDVQSSGKIYDYNLKTSEVYKNEYIRVDVYTNKAISKVWVEDSNNARVILKTSYDSVSGNEYTWELKFVAEEAGSSMRYTIYAEDQNGKRYDETFRVRVNK